MMMSQRKKQLYVSVIILCILATAGVFMFYKPAVPTIDPSLTDPSAPPDGPGVSNAGGSRTAVFPQSDKFDLTVFESDRFKLLKEYVPLTVSDAEIGRDDPFKSY